MAVTVEQILKLGTLAQARVLSGARGLDHAVTSVTVGEVPDIAEWLSGGEIVMSTMFALTNDTDRQRDFCRRIMAAGAAALFVKPKRFVGAFPLDILEIAEKRGFPIVEVPQEVRWTRIMQEAMEVLIDRQASLLEKSQEIHRQLLEVVISGGGWSDVASAAARLIEKPVLVLDVSLEALGVSADFPWPEAELHRLLDRGQVRSQFESLARSPSKLMHLTEVGVPSLFAVPIVVSHSCLGYVCTITERPVLEEMEKVALEHAATVAAVEMARDQVRFETEVRLKGDFVDDLIGGRFSSEDSLLRRANFLGCDISHGATVLVADVDEFEKTMTDRRLTEAEVQRLKARLFSRCTRSVSEMEPNSLVSLKSDRVIVFLTGESAVDLKALERLTGRLQSRANEVAELSLSVGVSRFTPELSGLRRAFEEALAALKVGRKLQGAGSVMHFDGVGSYKLLLSIWEHDPDELRGLYAETIDPVDRYDQQNDSQLLKTLTTYLANDENLSKTAEDLYAHRHTIRYRLQKIGDLTGLSVFKSEEKERLSLGLKAKSLLSG
ncbi:MAG TPA: PucR family transcriptional regulator ligand-binding domain-containing protein [Thermoleophilia bacterium]|nr:PucR family transcriptional regulator ligand-binding domain-containing protein [Thermoleophilia bacterium]